MECLIWIETFPRPTADLHQAITKGDRPSFRLLDNLISVVGTFMTTPIHTKHSRMFSDWTFLPTVLKNPTPCNIFERDIVRFL